jgi:hypothetical protein
VAKWGVLASPRQHASAQSLECETIFNKNSMTQFFHPPDSPNLVPCNFFLFPQMKQVLKGKRFAGVEEVKKKMTGIKRHHSATALLCVHNKKGREDLNIRCQTKMADTEVSVSTMSTVLVNETISSVNTCFVNCVTLKVQLEEISSELISACEIIKILQEEDSSIQSAATNPCGTSTKS